MLKHLLQQSAGVSGLIFRSAQPITSVRRYVFTVQRRVDDVSCRGIPRKQIGDRVGLPKGFISAHYKFCINLARNQILPFLQYFAFS